MPIFPRSTGDGDVIYLSQGAKWLGIALIAFCFVEFFIPGMLSRTAREEYKQSLPTLAVMLGAGILLIIIGQILKNKGH